MLTIDYDLLGVERGQLLLDLGSGSGRHAFESVRRGCRVVAVDTKVDELRAVADGLPVAAGTIAGDAVKLPFADATFDAIIAAEVLEHITDDRGAISELVRVLKPGGQIAVSVPAELSERGCWLLSSEYHAPAVAGGHVRVYTRARLTKLLTQAGLTMSGRHGAHGLHTPYWWLRCLFGPNSSPNAAVRAYHRFLVRDMTRRSRIQSFAGTLADRVLPKSLVLYATLPPSAGSTRVAAVA